MHAVLLKDENLKFAAPVQPTSRIPSRSRWCNSTDVALGFSYKGDSVPLQRYGYENYLEYIICNSTPTIILAILEAKFRVETESHGGNHTYGVLRKTVSSS